MNLQESLTRAYDNLRGRWSESEKVRAENALGNALRSRLFHNFYNSLHGAPFEKEEVIMDQLDSIMVAAGDLRVGRVIKRAVIAIRGTNLTEREAEAGYGYYKLYLQNIMDERVNFFCDKESRGVQFLAKCKEEGLDSRRVEEVMNAFVNPGNEAI